MLLEQDACNEQIQLYLHSLSYISTVTFRTFSYSEGIPQSFQKMSTSKPLFSQKRISIRSLAPTFHTASAEDYVLSSETETSASSFKELGRLRNGYKGIARWLNSQQMFCKEFDTNCITNAQYVYTHKQTQRPRNNLYAMLETFYQRTFSGKIRWKI